MKEVAHIKCHSCDELGHLAWGCPNKFKKKAQANKKKQGNEERRMSNEEKAQLKRKCYSCWERGHMANSCPVTILSLFQLMIILCLERMAMVPHLMQLQNIPSFILRQCLSMLHLT